MIWTLHRVRHHAVHPAGSSPSRGSARRSTSASSAIEESIDAAERTKAEADELLAEYRERLEEAREQADEIVARARKAGEVREPSRSRPRRGQREELMEQTRRDIEAETRRAIAGDPQRGRRPDGAGHREGHAQDARRGRPAPARRGGAVASSTSPPSARSGRASRWRRSPRSTRARCSRSPRSSDDLDEVREQLGAVRRRARRRTASCRCSSSRPTSRRDEKKDGLAQGGRGRRRGRHELPRAADREAPDAGDLPHPARVRRAVARGEQAAAGADHQRRRARRGHGRPIIGDEIGEQTGRKVELTADVDPDILGGIVLRVGNSILDASIRNRLEQLRKQVAKAA